jgi:hypothetical protein
MSFLRKLTLAVVGLFSTTVMAYAQFNSGSNYNTVNMSYQANSTLSQNIVFDSNMQAGGTFDLSVNAHAGGGRNLQHDTGNLKLEFFNSSGTLITSTQTSYSQNLLQMNSWSSAPGDNSEAWTTISLSYTLSATDAANTSYVKVTLIGTDASWWAGNYGPQWQMPTLTFNGGTTNILYNPEFGVAPNGVQAQGWASSTNYSGVCGTVSGSAACVTNATGVTANMSGGGYSASGGTTSGTPGGYTSTLTSTTILATVNNGGVAPSGGSPTVVSSAAGTPTVTTSSSNGTTVTTTSVTNGTPVVVITDSDAAVREGKEIVITRTTTTTTTTPVTTVTTDTTPVTTTTVTTPNTIDTYSDGSTTTTAGTPVTTTSVTNQVVTTTTTSNTVSTNVATASESASAVGMQDAIDAAVVNPFIIDPMGMTDGSWASPMYSSSSTSGTISSKTLSFGHQFSAEDSTVGLAGQAGQIESGSYNNSVTTGSKYAGTAYVFTKTDNVWMRGSVGFGINEYSTTMSLPTLALSNNTKAKQTMVYGDIAGYYPEEIYGFRPFIGATFLNSTIDSIQESGSSLLSSAPTAGTKTYVNPYVGVRKDIDKGIVVETKVMQTEQYGAVSSTKVIASQKIDKDISVNLTAGYDIGNGYSNGYALIGLVVKF